MKSLQLLAIALCISIASWSQKDVKLEEVGRHVGDSVKVCGKVASTRYFDNAKDKPTLLNIGAAFPNQHLTIVIKGDLRKEFEKAPEDFFKDKNICIVGLVELYRDKPQIVLTHKWQIGIE